MNIETLNSLRYCFQRILIPCVVIIGILGNFVSVLVLTRRRMRCSTNIYLTALAVADIVYLLFIFILSLEHYPNMHHSKYKIYWSTFGLSHWFCDASMYTSIYLTVSFTIERYIAVCQPLIGQVLCTESRAKRVIAGVVLICFILTISTAFEYKLDEQTKFYNKSYSTMSTEALCQGNISDAFINVENETSSENQMLNEKYEEMAGATTESDSIEQLVTGDAFYEYNDGEITKRSVKLWEINGISYNKSQIQNMCVKTVEIEPIGSELGMNITYRKAFYIFSSTFGTLIPLILLATFNCFLVAAVHRSHKMRHTMTNTRQSDRSTAQENKITVTLIAVVVLFLVCQTPSAVRLIYSMTDEETSNMALAINNICNFLTTFNAACNFLLYCALSDKYRKTVKELFFHRNRKKQNNMSSTYFSRGGNNQTATSFYSKAPTSAAGGNDNNIRSRPIKPKKSRFSISPTDYANFQAEMAVKNAKTQSLAAVDFQTENNRKQNSLQMKSLHNETSPTRQQKSSHKYCIHKKPSETSLTRAQSLIFPITTKHSPHCKDHPHYKV